MNIHVLSKRSVVRIPTYPDGREIRSVLGTFNGNLNIMNQTLSTVYVPKEAILIEV